MEHQPLIWYLFISNQQNYIYNMEKVAMDISLIVVVFIYSISVTLLVIYKYAVF